MWKSDNRFRELRPKSYNYLTYDSDENKKQKTQKVSHKKKT